MTSEMAGNQHKIMGGSTGKKRLRTSALLMIVAMLGVTGFQVYWLRNNYDREKQNLDIKTSAAFRQTILKLQASKLKLERFTLRFDSTPPEQVVADKKKLAGKTLRAKPIAQGSEPPISVINLIQEKMKNAVHKDSSPPSSVMISLKTDSMRRLLIDSLKQKTGSVKTISITSSDSFMITPDMISEVHVYKEGADLKKGNLAIRHRVNPVPAKDSFSFKDTKGNVYMERGSVEPLPEDIMLRGPMLPSTRGNTVFQFLYNVDSLSQKDSVTLQEVDSAYAMRLKEDRINVGFRVKRTDSTDAMSANTVTIGFSNPASFTLTLQSTTAYMFGKLKLPLLFSLLLVGITVASFVMLYRNMLKQQRLAELKNEFISNITHELKTPIATVGVAIEALKNFNAIHDPKRTQEYLAISQNELQRLNLLVDKVLRLSMFEKKEIELKYEMLNLQDVVEEVVSSMQLQVEKKQAAVTVNVEGDCSLEADRLHLLSVVFNLLDNALKYGGEKPVIKISLEEKENSVQLSIADNGIGIPAAYKDKVFDKFFRVPHGDIHNAKGYGLGLSYTAHVVKRHGGTISLDSEPGRGTIFTITMPKQKI